MIRPLLETRLPGLSPRRGKVRDVYDLGDGRLLVIATDRISAFDWVLPTGIPDKGRVLAGISEFWKSRLPIANDRLGDTLDDIAVPLDPPTRTGLEGRSALVRAARVVPFECVVRGYLSGSGWKEYRTSGTVCGQKLPEGLRESDRIDPPIFTPATKAEAGHDENVTFDKMADAIGFGLADDLRNRSLEIYRMGAEHAAGRGLILADTKFEFGRLDDGSVVLIDEVMTPDSSRYWPADFYKPGGPQPSFDKQFVRDWLEQAGWDKASPPPALPEDVVAKTREKYVEAYRLITGQAFPWT
ncbi:MAG: phosphoribosylaminoimidazolesuccinocarboxamide synthase [Isosphaeraceae bacterium]